MAERLTASISRDLREKAWGRYAPLMCEAADQLDALLILLTAAENGWDEARMLLRRYVDDEPCALDHHGYCQNHGLSERPCRNVAAIEHLGGVS